MTIKIVTPLPDRELDDLFDMGETGHSHAEGATKMPRGSKPKDSRPPERVKTKRRPKEDEDDDQ